MNSIVQKDKVGKYVICGNYVYRPMNELWTEPTVSFLAIGSVVNVNQLLDNCADISIVSANDNYVEKWRSK